ncbi:MAG TPA: hypothetical protein VIL26_08525 [Clostridia bacterium]
MSFFNCNKSDFTPGAISGNPLHGLCEKVCIQVKKVFDACIQQVQQDDLTITLNNFMPANPAFPLTFVSARSITTRGIVNNLTVTRLAERPRFARVRALVNIPMEVIYVDANNVEGRADAIIGITVDVILAVPNQSIIPYEVEAVVSAICPEGTPVNNFQMDVTACITIIIKITIEAELLVPSYGYCRIPECEEFTENICSSFFELPLYPQSE